MSVTRTMLACCLIAVLLSAGCRRKRESHTTVVNESQDIFTTDEFPGASVQDGNVADDQRAFSNSGENHAANSIRCTPNGSTGKMMVTYRTDSTLYAHYYDGETWTPPVSLGALDCNIPSIDADVIHAWVNTSEHPSPGAQARDGDCLLFWTANDADQDGAATADAVNRCLFLTYFDADRAGDPAARHGFQEFASRLSGEDESGEDVTVVAVCSDGLCGDAAWGSAFFGTSFGYRCAWGHATTSVTVVWVQREDNDGVAGFEDRALRSRHVQLDFAGDPALPLVPGQGVADEIRIAVDTYGASDTGTSSEETQVDTYLITYNGTVFFRVCANNTTAGDDNPSAMLYEVAGVGAMDGFFAVTGDSAVQAVSFDLATGFPSTATLCHAVAPVATDTLENSGGFILGANFGNYRANTTACQRVFGSDEGLACLAFFGVEFVDDADGFLDIANANRLSITELDEQTGQAIGHAFINGNDPAVADIAWSYGPDLQISRNGDYVAILFYENTAGGGFIDITTKASVYRTTRIDQGVPVPPLADSLAVPVHVNADIDGAAAVNSSFQTGLGYRCGIQSDPDVMNVMYEHSDTTVDTLHVARLTFSHTVPPTVTVDSVALESGDNLLGWNTLIGDNDGLKNWGCVDAGSGGHVVAYYVKDVATGVTATDFRLFAESTAPGGGTAEIGSRVDHRQSTNNELLFIVATPAGSEIGAFDPATGLDSPDRPHPAEFVHVIFREDESTEDSGLGDAARTRVFEAASGQASFGDRFTPSAGTTFLPPFDLDLPHRDPSTTDDARLVQVAAAGNRFALLFTEYSRIYWQEFTPEAGWLALDGESNPWLVDDDVEHSPASLFASFSRTCGCDTLHGLAIFWIRADDPAWNRIHVRVRSDD